MKRRRLLAVVAGLLLAGLTAVPAQSLSLPSVGVQIIIGNGCPAAPDPAALPSADELRAMNQFVADLGIRRTGSPTQQQYVDWIEQHLAAIPGVQITEQPFTIDRWTPQSTGLQLTTASGTTALPVAAAVDNALPTGPDGVTAPFTAVPDGVAITAANAAGKIVVRHAPAGTVQQALFYLPIVSWAIYDPHLTIDPLANFKGDFINYLARIADLQAAAAAGAAGLVFVKDLPTAQLIDHEEPYEGTHWGVPALWLGADEGKQINDAIAAGENPIGRLSLQAAVEPTVTKSVYATINGQSPQRIVIDSHTDGSNAVEDNGPVAMLAMARYFAALPLACRPRTIEFAFATAHFYQRVADPNVRNGGAEQLAQQLDRDYDKGTVSAVLSLEHLGALEYQEAPRTDGGAGVQLEQTGRRELQEIFITPSPALVAAVLKQVVKYDLDRTLLLQGADAPGATAPQHCDFGGEGTPYNKHVLPTIGEIAAPQTLYDPAFGMEGIDFRVMHDELLAFTGLLLDMGRMSQLAIDGTVPVSRALRAAGMPTCP